MNSFHFLFFVQGNCSGAILENEVVSIFVFENLDLVPRDQSSVIAVKDLDAEDKVKLVARLVRQSRGPSFVPKYKYALDSVNQIVYVLVADAEDAESMTGRSFRVDGQHVSFSRVLKMKKRAKDDDFYQSIYCSQIWPMRQYHFQEFPRSSLSPWTLWIMKTFVSISV